MDGGCAALLITGPAPPGNRSQQQVGQPDRHYFLQADQVSQLPGKDRARLSVFNIARDPHGGFFSRPAPRPGKIEGTAHRRVDKARQNACHANTLWFEQSADRVGIDTQSRL